MLDITLKLIKVLSMHLGTRFTDECAKGDIGVSDLSAYFKMITFRICRLLRLTVNANSVKALLMID